MSTTGNIDTRHSGIVMMFTSATSSDTNNNAKEGFCVWNSALWAWGAGGLRKYSSGTWSSIYSTATVNYAFPSGTYLFFCPDGLRIQKVDTSDTVTDAGNDNNATDYSWMIAHKGYVYAGKDDTNYVHRDSTEDLSDLEGTTADTDIITVGQVGGPATIGAETFMGNLYVFRNDGVWMIGDDMIATRILDFTNEASDDNFRSAAVHNGYLLFPIRDKIYQWNGARLSDVTPPRLTDSFPYTTYGRFDNFVAAGRFLYCTARTNETTYAEDLLCFDGVAWVKLMRLVSNGSDTISAMGYDSVNNYLWYHLDSTTDATYYIPFQSQSEFPYAAFPTSGTHELITSRWDMVYRDVIKSSPSIIIEASNVTASRYLTVYYKLDNGSWVEWDKITSNGVTTLDNPGGNLTVEYNYITIKITFTTNAAAQSPILEGISLRFIMRPEEAYGWSVMIPIAKDMELGVSRERRMPKKVISDLRAARNNKAPIEFIDISGEIYYVYVTAISSELVEWDRDEGGDSPITEMVVALNLAEVK